MINSQKKIFYQDFKKFINGDVAFGVGQINSMNSDELEEIENRIRPIMGQNAVSMNIYGVISC